jgi:Glycine rich protein
MSGSSARGGAVSDDGTSTAQARLDRIRSPLLAAPVAAFAIALLAASSAVAETISTTFSYTGAEQTFTVPAGVTSVHVVATGAVGGTPEEGGTGGRGAVVSGDLSVTPGEALYAEVGGQAQEVLEGLGGFNGGGNGTGSGGGASDVRTAMRSAPNTLESRLLVAAGGGGGGDSYGIALGGEWAVPRAKATGSKAAKAAVQAHRPQVVLAEWVSTGKPKRAAWGLAAREPEVVEVADCTEAAVEAHLPTATVEKVGNSTPSWAAQGVAAAAQTSSRKAGGPHSTKTARRRR